MNYDLIIQNNASKEIHLYRNLENETENGLYMTFSNIELGVKDGEYNYYVVESSDGREYDFSEVPLNTEITDGEYKYRLSDLHPVSGLLRVGKVTPKNTYNKRDNKTFYYNK